MNVSPELRDIVAKALYEQSIEGAREQIAKIPFDAKELPQIFERLQRESETAQILVFGSYLEDRIHSLIKAQLFYLDTPKLEDAVFGSNGPLSSFSSRLTLTYHFGWLSPLQKKKLDAFRKIRNEFAHRAFKVKFSDPVIAAHFATIDYDVPAFLRQMGKDAPAGLIISENELTKSAENLGNLAILAIRTFLDYLVQPSALANRVDPNDVLKDRGKHPPVLKALYFEGANTVGRLFQSPDGEPIE